MKKASVNENRYAEIDAFLQRCMPFSEEELDIFHSFLTYQKFKKKSILLQQGEICKHESYIIKGCARTFYTDANGHDITLLFAVEDYWLGDIASFYKKTPSRFNIQLIEDTELLQIDYEAKEALLEQLPKFERVFRIMVQNHLASTQNRLVNNIAFTAAENYAAFLKQFPNIPQRVPQHYIASYLGISPEFLSKIRNDKKAI
ncbi:Crp/Fnr family transcriptional regulator [Flavobacterium aurantiibacter]|uniref:Crp/Fnr family transcriptional regulator n=1 Tax=Flavobacterium aurantiibacter TaxID=2023067 RepID=A0A256A205_9FLAO|nr:Crp/Fnr family transcriptional regulator [Flavobacterium aurantiibacter]OYQ47788.1 Crp/Fnr family transcriptional regulator [Flavobacterium aurantiibacter]